MLMIFLFLDSSQAPITEQTLKIRKVTKKISGKITIDFTRVDIHMTRRHIYIKESRKTC